MVCVALGKFQFQNGAVKSQNNFQINMTKCSFNSKMVRLNDKLISQNTYSDKSFNSKMVRLKAAGGYIAYTQLYNCFNSKMVRLKDLNQYPVASTD